jgi:hypothetical protein
MATFDETDHPRKNTGTFSSKLHGEPEVHLVSDDSFTIVDPVHGALHVSALGSGGGFVVKGSEGTVNFVTLSKPSRQSLIDQAMSAYDDDAAGQRVSPTREELATVTFEDGQTLSLPGRVRDRLRGLSAEGYVVVSSPDWLEEDGKEVLYGLTPCCLASGKGLMDEETFEGYIGCRSCYQEVDPAFGVTLEVTNPVRQ